MEKRLRAVAGAVMFTGALGTGEVASAGPLTDAFDARDQLVQEQTRACGDARVAATEARRDLRLAQFDLDNARDDDERVRIRRDMLEIAGDLRVEQEEIISRLREDIADHSRVYSQRTILELQGRVPAYIADCARSGQ